MLDGLNEHYDRLALGDSMTAPRRRHFLPRLLLSRGFNIAGEIFAGAVIVFAVYVILFE